MVKFILSIGARKPTQPTMATSPHLTSPHLTEALAEEGLLPSRSHDHGYGHR